MEINRTQNHWIRITWSIVFTIFINFSFAQTDMKVKMKKLNFMIGDWVGTSTTYDQGKIKNEVPAYQKISYDLDSTIIVIELHSETLHLHTIINYDEKENKYFYHPFSKKGVRKVKN